jgi:hypothetical protein
MEDTPTRSKSKTGDRRTSAGLISVAEPVAKLSQPHFSKRGLISSRIIWEWPTIVGSALAISTLPIRASFQRGKRDGGVLHIKVISGAMALQIQHLVPLIIQRINGYFGYAAIERISIAQGGFSTPLRPVRKKPAAPALTPAQEQDLASRLDRIEDPDLKAVLTGLGRHLAVRRP